MAGFLFLSVAKTAHAGFEGYGAADITGNSLSREDAIAVDERENNPEACEGLTWLKTPIICALAAVLGFVSLLLEVAATLFGWVVQVGNMNALLNAGATGTGGSVIYQLWTMVRDLLNIAFILVLLFSAFATIFQIEKFNYKKLLLNLILMALLVNFSYPIARFIIDVSNVLMYTLIRNVLAPVAPGGDATRTFGILAENAGLANMLNPASTSIAYLLAAIVFTFLLAITLLAVGVMFIIRMVALTILIIFSPIAFVGAILPGKAAGFAGQWWDNLFKYAFFGPIMIFIIYITVKIMGAMGTTEVIMTFIKEGKDNATEPNLVAAIAFFSIPIVLLWMGMSLGQKMGIAGAATVMGAAQKTGSWAGKKFSGYNAIKRNADAYKSKRDERQKEKNKTSIGGRLGDKANDISDTARGVLPFGEAARKRMAKRHKDKNKDDIDKGAKDLVDGGATAGSLASTVNEDFNNPSADKIEIAKHATAYLRQDADDQKMHIQSTLESAKGIKNSGLEHMINDGGKGLTPGSLAHDEYQSMVSAAKRIGERKTGEKVEENDIRMVSTFVRKQMKKKVEVGANAESRPNKTISSFKSMLSRSNKTSPPPKPVKLAETPEERVNREEREDQKFNR